MRKLSYFIFAAVFIFALFRLVDVGGAVKLIPDANANLVVIAILIGVAIPLLIAKRLTMLYSIYLQFPYSYILAMDFLGAFISTLLPLSAGGFSMAYFVAKKGGISYKKSFAIIFIDFMMGVSVTIFTGLIAIYYFSVKKLISFGPSFESTQFIIIALLLVFSMTLFIVSKFKMAKGVSVKLKNLVKLFAKRKKIIFSSILITFLVALLVIVQSYLFLLAFGLSPKLVDFILATGLFGLISIVTLVPAKIGQYETFGVLTLPYLLSLDKTKVFSALLLQHVISLAIVVVAGAVSAYYLRGDFGSLWEIISKSLKKE